MQAKKVMESTNEMEIINSSNLFTDVTPLNNAVFQFLERTDAYVY